MAQTLELRVVAEGIETDGQLRFLNNIGCELGQGYLFSPAVPIQEIEAMLAPAHYASTVRPVTA